MPYVPVAQLKDYVGKELGRSEWLTIDQARINLFAEATGDHQFIHVDPVKAAKTPFGSTIAHGFLSLSLMPKLMEDILIMPEGLKMAVNYGLDSVRFIQPVKVDSKVRLNVTLTDVNGSQLSFSRSRVWLPVSPVAQAPVFSRVTIPIPQGDATFSYAQVASWSMTVTNRLQPQPRLGWVVCYLDHLMAVPPSIQAAPVTRGYVYTLQGLVGTVLDVDDRRAGRGDRDSDVLHAGSSRIRPSSWARLNRDRPPPSANSASYSWA